MNWIYFLLRSNMHLIYISLQETNQVVRQDLNESTLDLSLGLNAHDGDNDPDSKADHRDS